jgi:hypothetical protein
MSLQILRTDIQSDVSRTYGDESKGGCHPGCCAVLFGRRLTTFQRCLLPPSSDLNVKLQ